MSILQRLKQAVGMASDDGKSDIELLRDLLREREASLSLTAVYGQPRPNMTDEPTVVFPYSLYTADGEHYGNGQKEFVLPDNGLEEDSNLTAFISIQAGADMDSVTFEDLLDVEGTESNADIDYFGDVEVYMGDRQETEEE